ncbi:MAG: DUF3224 domain-containing protein [Actinobacteria bacterium]|nr:MAG: DUF3224 domain-containing protein [Actinomycetota bacterium]
MRKTGRLCLLLAPLVIVLAVVATTSAAAAPRTLANGTVGNTSSTFNSVRAADGNLIVDLSATASYTGTFSGTSTLHGILIIHADGSANFHDVETFTGTVNGVPGTVTFNLTGSNDAALAVHATATIIGASGDLAGLHGVLHEVGTVIVPTGPVGTYSGKIG